MKSIFHGAALAVCLLLAMPAASVALRKASQSASSSAPQTYLSVPNDPLKARIYTLANGLKVYMSVNKNEPRIQTLIATRAGSKNDPNDATGLAHYLEHMLFKGTDKYGSLDYSKEKPLLNEIEGLYEQYRSTTDNEKRKAIYHRIDSVSGVAAKYAIANEYDKMMASIGAKNTNAYTSFEQTVYINDIPSNQLRKWLDIEAERFRNPEMRIFHTELEAVYEEKNRTLDSDDDQVYESLFEGLFPTHTYGTQTTIGTVAHLKNPSIKKILDYYRKYYVPNNMAIAISGDFDPDKVIGWINDTFGKMPRGAEVPKFSFAPEKAINSVVKREVFGPDAEYLMMGYRFPGSQDPDTRVLKMIDMILANSTAGLIDLNLNQAQKVLKAGCSPEILADYSVHIFRGQPREGQSLEEVEKLLLGQIQLVKEGKFDNSIIPAILNNLQIDQIRKYQTNWGRASDFVDAFIKQADWKEYVNEMNELSRITKKQIVDVANKYYANNYVIVYKRTGENKNLEKVEKPPITPVELNRGAESQFVRSITGTDVDPIQPRFVDFEKDILKAKLANGLPVHYLRNDENELFTLIYLFETGSQNDKKLPLAIEYLKFLGTDKMSAEEFNKQMFALGCSFNVNTGTDQVYISLSGLGKNLEQGVALFEDLLANAKPDNEALQAYIDGVLKERENMKLDKRTILFNAMKTYGMYGAKNPFNDVLSNEALKAVTAQELTRKIKDLANLEHRILFYGPQALDKVTASLGKLHRAAAKRTAPPQTSPYTFAPTDKNTVYFVDFDMVQAEIMWLSKSMPYSPAMSPVVRLYNEYFGGGMSSVVFQTIRESKALAYSTFSNFSPGSRKEDPYFSWSYVGTQADKLNESISAMNELLTTLPDAAPLFAQAKQSIKNKIETERVTREAVLFNYISATRMGLDRDIRGDIYRQLPNLDFAAVNKFYTEQIKGKPYTMLVLGSKDKVNKQDLAKYGRVQELSLKELFGY